ncbi:phosphoinositide-3-kinase-interacting protein 1 [Lynx pardinus]|uniref:Phosphoinositide-3-kinase-interacting protein 1 n=1 Tax=Lynx pardinus TaxID=191816 RepID=A0A485MMF3_LYNPA|nr:phosphoinositide-3-kinase-interacting protein 1 [Lynx pardinus]
MLLAWVKTFLIGNMLLAEAYGSGGFCPTELRLLKNSLGRECCLSKCGHIRERNTRVYVTWNYNTGMNFRAGCPPTQNSERLQKGTRTQTSPTPSSKVATSSRASQPPFKAETTSQSPPTFTTETEEASEVPSGDEVQVFAPANALPARSEAAAVQPVIGISQRVRVNSKEKKDLGTLGYVLGITMMVIIIAIGAGIVLGYTYKRGKDLKEQHDQRVCEREMQRITLPLSAFTNPTCEIVDEKTIVVHTNQTPVDLQEGSAPLMGQAGTPGA